MPGVPPDTPYRRARLALALLPLLALTAACAGTPQAAGAPEPALSLAGSWVGEFQARNFSGDMVLTLDRDGEAWSGQIELVVGTESRTAEVEDFEQDGTSFHYVFFMDGGDVVMVGEIGEGAMTGSFEVFVDMNLVDDGTYRLTRQ